MALFAYVIYSILDIYFSLHFISFSILVIEILVLTLIFRYSPHIDWSLFSNVLLTNHLNSLAGEVLLHLG